jgi:hypothetical protein
VEVEVVQMRLVPSNITGGTGGTGGGGAGGNGPAIGSQMEHQEQLIQEVVVVELDGSGGTCIGGAGGSGIVVIRYKFQ